MVNLCFKVIIAHSVWSDTMRLIVTLIITRMKGYIAHIESETIHNTDYRRVIYTGKNSQLVLMSIEPGDEIGLETHHLDQFIRIEEGKARVDMDGVLHEVQGDWAVIVPAGMKHNVTNIGDAPLKLYTLYAPPEHMDGTVQATKADEKEEHWDGKTTE